MNIRNNFEKYNIDKNSPMPIYYQLEQVIQEMINSNELNEGDKIPTEEELCEIYNISRMTVRHAIAGLVNSGILIKKKAIGTFITSRKHLFQLSELHSFTDDMKKRGFNVTNTVLEKKIIKVDENLKNTFNINKISKILKIKRLRKINNEPLAIEISHIPLSIFSGIENEDFSTGSLFNIFEKKYNQRLSHSEQSLEPVIATADECKYLNIKKASPLLKMTGITYAANNLAIEYVIGYYRGDRYKFKLTLKR